MGILQSEKFSPFIFVGLGGSGNKVVDRIARKLRNHPYFDRIQDLVHFVAIDTNKHDLNRNRHIPEQNHFLISSFDRATYIDRKRGKYELAEDELVTQWAHEDYKFREGSTPGAGQIRIESRLSLYYSLEDDRAGMVKKFKRILDDATKPDAPWREERDRLVNVMVYGSAAGGTGSGSFVPMAYLLRQLVEDHGWGRAKVVGNLMLPSLFHGFVEQVLQPDINANAYATLKEIEHLTRLGYPGRQEEEQFQYNPLVRRKTVVRDRPFALLYLIDKPSELTVESHYDALADASFLQVFSPLLGQQEGEYDNYEKHQKQLAQGHFTVHYGSYGSAVMHFPRQDLLAYSRRRYIARAFDKFLNFGDDPRFAVDWDDKRFQLLNESERNRQIDEKYALWIAHKAELERDEDLAGVFTAIHDQKNPKDDPLAEVFRTKLAALMTDVEAVVQVETLDPTQVNENQPSLQRPLNQMRRDVTDSRSRMMERVSSVQADVNSGRFFSEFFRDNGVNPLAQRYFLIKLAALTWRTEDGRDERRIGPSADPEDNGWLFEAKENDANLDAETTLEGVRGVERTLAQSAQRGLVRFGENKKFLSAKRAAQALFDELADQNREWLKIDFWQRFHADLQSEIERRLGAFRAVARLSAEQVSALKAEAEAFMKEPGAIDPDAQAAAYHLDLEVLRDDRRGVRLWDLFFRHRFDRAENFDDKEIFDVITKAFSPAQEGGRVRAKDAREIVQDIRKGLDREAGRTFDRALADMHDMHLAGALELEARYSLAGPEANNDDVAAVSPDRVEEYMRDKIRRAVASCVVLAHLNRTKFDDPTVTPNQSAFVGIHPRYRGESRLSLEKMIRAADSGLEVVEDWGEEDVIVLYRAVLGIPLYFFTRVADEYQNDYVRAQSDPNRTYPLHIDKNFEALPNLDPIEIQQAEIRRKQREEAARELASRHERIWGFSSVGLAGLVEHRDGQGYVLIDGTETMPLAARRFEAFAAFQRLPADFQNDLIKQAGAAITRADSSRKERERVVARLDTWAEKLKALYRKAVFADDEAEQRFLEEERDLVSTQADELRA